MIIQTDRLILRPFEEGDACSIYNYAKDSAVADLAGWPAHKDIDDSLYVIKHILNGPECYAICLKENNLAIGSIELLLSPNANIEIADDEAELGYWIGEPFWGRGLVPEAAKALINRAFNELNIKQIWCQYFEGNLQSRRVIEKCGFKFHHTDIDAPWALMGDTRTVHYNCLINNSNTEVVLAL